MKKFICFKDFTLEFTTKNVIIHLKAKDLPFDIKSLTIFQNELMRIIFKAYFWLWDRLRIQVTPLEAQVIHQEIANKLNLPESLAENINNFELQLNRNAVALNDGKLDEKAKAWIDKSYGLELETNDKLYEQALVEMPLATQEINKKMNFIVETEYRFAKLVDKYTKNMDLHFDVLVEMRNTLRDIRKEQSELMQTLKQVLKQAFVEQKKFQEEQFKQLNDTMRAIVKLLERERRMQLIWIISLVGIIILQFILIMLRYGGA